LQVAGRGSEFDVVGDELDEFISESLSPHSGLSLSGVQNRPSNAPARNSGKLS